ncbi:hypothetical protein BDB00DRAFT_805224 [Zychaea mexicana]|uniref:uncharacterized protein n=1 Tax=Zychaea mexicana TaxID=64656 RepID=UPI0022FF2B8C|nr:uncharacterized protein BDB00DRAFT_805224 [Zychaea mexicana]KAI9497156.1 hypothetical protein BDB00DRAFT_805224 [Zychaea mexicana]
MQVISTLHKFDENNFTSFGCCDHTILWVPTLVHHSPLETLVLETEYKGVESSNFRKKPVSFYLHTYYSNKKMAAASPVFLLTGASRGIGKATALAALTTFNARVVAVARNADLLKELQSEADKLGKADSLVVVAGDVTDIQIVKQSVALAIEKWGQLDAIIANAGVVQPLASVADVSIEEFKRSFDINFFSIVSLIQEALPHLRKSKGSIIMVSSGAASRGYLGWAAYGSSKAAMNHLASTLSAEESDVTSIAIRPGIVDTDMQSVLRAEGKESMKDDHQKFIDLYNSGALVRPEQSGHVLAALAAKPPRAMTGSFCSWDDESLKDYRL